MKLLSRHVRVAISLLICTGFLGAEESSSIREIEGVPYLRDRDVIRTMSQQAIQQQKTWNLLNGDEAKIQRKDALKKKAVVELPSPGRKKKNLADLFEMGRESTLVVGRLYICDRCDKVHFNVAFTAFAISKDGVCVTNFHCLNSMKGPSTGVREFLGFVVRTWDGRLFPVSEVLAGSELQDLAILKLDLPEGESLTPLRLGPTARVGDAVYTISHPKSMLYRFSTGMVTRNTIESSGGRSDSQAERPRMCISADYGVGSSGGPVLDERGNVIGVIAATRTVYSSNPQTENRHPQMVEHKTIPVAMIRELITEEK